MKLDLGVIAMFAFLPKPLKILISGSLLLLNTVFWTLLVYPIGLIKVLVPMQSARKLCNKIMIAMAEAWVSINNFNFSLTQKIKWDVQGLEGLDRTKSYLVISNHQSWVDIPVLQHALHRRIPFLRFFLKHQLIYVPLLGGAWWALDFPFMKRYSREYLEKHPEKKGEDLKATQKACERFRGSPISVLNFLEGTRYTKIKHIKQKSFYKNLLKPKAGGLAFVTKAMGDQFDSILDVTIIYPQGVVSLLGLLGGEMPEVMMKIVKREIPADFLSKDYLNDDGFRSQAQTWVREIWAEKDQWIEDFKKHS